MDVSARLNRWQWTAFFAGSAVVLGMLAYPPWHCFTGTGYRVPPETLRRLGEKPPAVGDFPPNLPMAYCGHRDAVVYGWLFGPPRQFAGTRWNAEIEWGRLGPRCGVALFVLVGILISLRDGGVVLRLAARCRRGPAAERPS